MREIKFRGWDEKNKEMVYNIKLLFSNHLNECFEEYEECGLKIMQYTGLKDKNGVKIFEGDILRDDEYIVIVKFVDGLFGVDYRTIGGKWRNYGDLFEYIDECDGEVIGNVHENPEVTE